jgi:RNA polymerase sigma-70 factor, ECF subfamily
MKRAIKDKLLLNRLKRQEQAAFAEVYDVYVEKIYRFVFFKVGSAEEAQDLTSEIFLKTWNHVCGKREVEVKTLPALLYKIARNTVIDHYRKSRQNISIDIETEDGVSLDLPDEKQNLPEMVDLGIDLERLQIALSELKDEYREVILMRYIEELSINEIAEVLDKNKGNVRVLIYRALQALKEVIKAENPEV